MQTYDLLMLLVLVCATMFGFWKGMAWQLASLASLFVSGIVALKFSDRLAPNFGDTAPFNRIVAMLAIYVVTSFIIWTAFRLISGVIDKVKLEAFDKQLGAMFGFAKGVLVCVGATFFLVALLPQAQSEMISSSLSGQYTVVFLDKANAVLPPEIHQVIDPYLNKVQERLNANRQAGWPGSGGAGSGSAGQQTVPAQSTGWSWPSWPKSEQLPQVPKVEWPQTATPQQPSAYQQPVWPSQTQQSQSAPANYGAPREPNQFPDPYSAERPASATY